MRDAFTTTIASLTGLPPASVTLRSVSALADTSGVATSSLSLSVSDGNSRRLVASDGTLVGFSLPTGEATTIAAVAAAAADATLSSALTDASGMAVAVGALRGAIVHPDHLGSGGSDGSDSGSDSGSGSGSGEPAGQEVTNVGTGVDGDDGGGLSPGMQVGAVVMAVALVVGVVAAAIWYRRRGNNGNKHGLTRVHAFDDDNDETSAFNASLVMPRRHSRESLTPPTSRSSGLGVARAADAHLLSVTERSHVRVWGCWLCFALRCA